MGTAVVSDEAEASAPPLDAPAAISPTELIPQIADAPAAQSASGANPTTTIPIETLSGRFIWISLWRAFRLQIHSHEVLKSERKALSEDAQHIVDPEQQAFLAWRRSVLLLVAIAFVPLTVLRFIEGFQGPPMPAAARIVSLLPAVAEALFCAIAFDQLKNWTKWKKQRRILFIAWALYMAAPFVVYLYPFRSAFDVSIQQAREIMDGMPIRITKRTVEAAIGFGFGIKAFLVLGPKIISLMPGLIRASIVSKLLFPGTSAPGWLMIGAAPFYALFVYIIVLLPYQYTGSWQFVAGNIGLLGAQVFIAWSGRVFTTPLDTEDAHRRIHRAWMAYVGLMGLSAGFIVFGLYEFISMLDLGVIRVFSSVLSVFANILLLTLICTDAIVGGMAYFQHRSYSDPQREELLRESEARLGRFSA